LLQVAALSRQCVELEGFLYCVRQYPIQVVFAVVKTFAEIDGEADNGG